MAQCLNIRSITTEGNKKIPNFIYGDATGTLPFDDKSVDHITVESPVSRQYDKWVKEMLRIIKPGGTMRVYGAEENMEKYFPPYFKEQNPNVKIEKDRDYLGRGGMGWNITVPK